MRTPLFPCKNKPSIFRRLKWRLENIYWFIRNLPCNIKRLFEWFPIIWKDADFDYICLLKILSYKMQRMEKHFEECRSVSHTPLMVKQLRYGQFLISRILENDYCKKEWEEHEEEYGQLCSDIIKDEDDLPEGHARLEIYYDKAKKKDKQEKAHQVANSLYSLANERRDRDLERLTKHIHRYLRKWWD